MSDQINNDDTLPMARVDDDADLAQADFPEPADTPRPAAEAPQAAGYQAVPPTYEAAATAPAQRGTAAHWIAGIVGVILVLVLMAGSFGTGVVVGRRSAGGVARFGRGRMMQPYGYGGQLPQGQQPQGQLPPGHPPFGNGNGGGYGRGYGRGFRNYPGQPGAPWAQPSPDATMPVR